MSHESLFVEAAPFYIQLIEALVENSKRPRAGLLSIFGDSVAPCVAGRSLSLPAANANMNTNTVKKTMTQSDIKERIYRMWFRFCICL